MRSFTTASVLSVLAVLALLAPTASGCSSKAADAALPVSAEVPVRAPDLASSGSRLQAKFLTGGGAHPFMGFHDSMRNEDCTFQEAETGHMRCLPVIAPASPSGLFSDAACTIAVAAQQPCGADVKYGVITKAVGNCGQVTNELRSVLPASSPTYALGQGGCAIRSAGSPAPRTGPVVALGDVVPWTDFVDATESTVPGDVVAERALVASDGAKQHIGFHDPTLNVDCTFQVIADGAIRCVPEASTGPIAYSDSSCATPFMVDSYPGSQQGGECAQPALKAPNLWLEPSDSACGGVRNVYTLRDYTGPGNAVQVYRYFSDGSGTTPTPATCTSGGKVSASSYGNQKSIANTITQSLPQVPRTTRGADRLVPALVWPPGATNDLVPGFHDTEKHVDCVFTLASDNKMRCLPVASSATLYFTDDSCKSASLLAIPANATCFDTNRFATNASATCPPTTTVYALAATASGQPGSVVTSPGSCATVTGGDTIKTARDAIVVDPTQFVEGVPSVE